MAANPRAAAVAALVRQEQDGFSNLVLDAELKRQQLEGRDKAFASAIFYTVLATKPLTVACGEGAVQLLNVVPEGKKPMDGTAFAAGQRLKTGDIL